MALRILESSANETETSVEEVIPKKRKKNAQDDKNVIKKEMEIETHSNTKQLEYELTKLLDTEAIDEGDDDIRTKTLVDLDNGNSIKVIEQEENTYRIYNTEIQHSHTPEAVFIEDKEIATKQENHHNSNLNEMNDDLSEQNEQKVQQILEQIEQGGLMLVSSIDAQNEDNVINEIYMIDKNTGDLCEKPLNLPDDILQAIIDLAT